MSITQVPGRRKATRRRAEDVRAEALAEARRLLVAGGPGAVTLKAVGAALGMSHANLIHHFGSADDLQGELMNAMVRDVTDRVRALIARRPGKDVVIDEVVDLVFDAYAAGGIGMLAAWLATTRRTRRTRELIGVIKELVAMIDAAFPREAGRKGRDAVKVVTMMAFADSLIGVPLAAMTGEGEPDGRRLAKAFLASL